MLKNYVPAQHHTITDYDLTFDDGHNNGFCFPCDASGNLLPAINPAAVVNYHSCMEHPEKFIRFNKVIPLTRRVTDNAHGTCSCGKEVELYDAYYGACQCEKCGQWYNLFGQALVSPEHWEHDPSEEECY